VGNGFVLAGAVEPGESSIGKHGDLLNGWGKQKEGREGREGGNNELFCIWEEFAPRARVQDSITLSLSLSIFISSYIGACFPNAPSNILFQIHS
jgi:hypothetical protein